MLAAVLLTASLGSSAIALPPPLCRGKVVTRYDVRRDASPSQRALAEVQTAYETLCPKNNCGDGELFQNDTIGNNAVTWVSGIRDGRRTRAKIVYSARFLNILEQSFGSGASFGVLAHEVGHHLTAALSMRHPFESSWNEELRADYLAGCALGRAARPPDDLENALRALASTASPTHPSFHKRNPVVRKGYDDCRPQAEILQQQKPGFGLSRVLKQKKASNPQQCWRYAYRLREDIERVGPVVSKVRRSDRFGSQVACESHRETMTGRRTRVSKPCVCE